MKKYKAMSLSCIDPRFQPLVYNYFVKRKLKGKYSSFTIAGAAIGVTNKKFKKWHTTFFENLFASGAEFRPRLGCGRIYPPTL